MFRHRPHEPGLRKVLPWLAAEWPDLFNAFQQTQGEQLETAMKALTSIGYVALPQLVIPLPLSQNHVACGPVPAPFAQETVTFLRWEDPRSA